jgi:hypothetical protein
MDSLAKTQDANVTLAPLDHVRPIPYGFEFGGSVLTVPSHLSDFRPNLDGLVISHSFITRLP